MGKAKPQWQPLMLLFLFQSALAAGKAVTGKAAPAAGPAVGKPGLADPAKKRTVLSDSSNKVQQGPANAAKAGSKLSLVVEEKPVSSRTLRSSHSKQELLSAPGTEDHDGDAVMENAEAASRPVKSLRSSSNKALASKSTNIPAARPTAGSTKNAGLRHKRNAAAAQPAVKVEVEEAPLNENNKRRGHPDESRAEIALHEDVEPPAQERRRSKRLRPSNPEDPAQVVGSEELDLDKSVAETVARIMESDVGSEMQEEVDEIPKDAGWEDLDAGDESDPLMVAEYVVEIHDYMKDLEVRFHVTPGACSGTNHTLDS